MHFFRKRRHRMAFTLVEVLAVSGLMAGLHAKGNYGYALNMANELKGKHNLKQVHMLLQMKSMMGGLPRAAFYPKGDPKKDPRSIIRLLGTDHRLFVSPFAPQTLQKKGLTFAWNDTVNGKRLDNLPPRTWLLIDLAAFIADPRVPKPEKYLVLYADGTTKAVADVPADIAKAVEAARKRTQGDKAP
jgi:hypothetical protein